jgi:hypothetical protein
MWFIDPSIGRTSLRRVRTFQRSVFGGLPVRQIWSRFCHWRKSPRKPQALCDLELGSFSSQYVIHCTSETRDQRSSFGLKIDVVDELAVRLA